MITYAALLALSITKLRVSLHKMKKPVGGNGNFQLTVHRPGPRAYSSHCIRSPNTSMPRKNKNNKGQVGVTLMLDAESDLNGEPTLTLNARVL